MPLIKSRLFKQAKMLVTFLVIALLSPVVLGKLDFWKTSQASPQFKSPNESISYPQSPTSYSEAISRASPAVVSIHSTKALPKDANNPLRDPFFRYFFGDTRNMQIPQEMQTGIGSGVIVTKDGYILTNNHVIQDADEITVKMSDGRSAKAKAVGSDPETDLAILKIDQKDLPIIAIGNSEALKVGDVVFAIGNPFGVGQTVTQGIISATHRTDLGISTFENFIQTDAAINPGNSGGALIDANGNLIGINNAIYTRTGGYQGIGFAIPISLAKDVMSELINQGHVTRGWLGISLGKLTDDIRKSINYPTGEGAVIAGIIRGGPAFTAGLRPGDVIISIDGKETSTPSEALSITSKLKPDTAYPIAIVRNGETLDFRVVVTKRPVKAKIEQNPTEQQ
ncbi:trypsin-like peptidase domain-containing protein [Candidatus Berkiella aquae]|uniref:Putative periplasmic serine endoprotease DegP-like n=1 Tax=Candidatus Berkiella aquae TaxID=295108 RepID=A0A0Q9YW42_9GAMM|nr:trypsin-like peptidase domain-containing protein [Candidatus Berkiella aquae]MCS5710125.1 trypsin-like peptidase domain-containing protein [Candidatus Berkiella aquae]